MTEFLKTAGEELRRTGEEIKAEAQRLLEEVRDPELQAKLKERIQQLGQAAKKTAADAAAKVQEAFGGKPKRPARRAKAKAKGGKKGAARRGGGRRSGRRR